MEVIIIFKFNDIKKQKQRPSSLKQGMVSFHEELSLAKEEMDAAFNRFQYAVHPDLIDCYIFQGMAAGKKYSYLLKKMR